MRHLVYIHIQTYIYSNVYLYGLYTHTNIYNFACTIVRVEFHMSNSTCTILHVYNSTYTILHVQLYVYNFICLILHVQFYMCIILHIQFYLHTERKADYVFSVYIYTCIYICIQFYMYNSTCTISLVHREIG